MSFLTLHIAEVGTAWPLLGSPRNGLADLHLFQKTFATLGLGLFIFILVCFICTSVRTTATE
jgi:hypothetical protein